MYWRAGLRAMKWAAVRGDGVDAAEDTRTRDSSLPGWLHQLSSIVMELAPSAPTLQNSFGV